MDPFLPHKACIGLGANLGPRERTLRGALRELGRRPGVRINAVSELLETAPVGGPPQPPYLNAAAALDTSLEPLALLHVLQDVEAQFGRERAVRWGPRTVDLDLLLYDDVVLDTPELVLPHARMHERTFVLAPLAQVAPRAVHPVLGLTVQEMLDGLED